MKHTWTELYRIGEEDKIVYIHFDSEVTGLLNDVEKNELNAIKKLYYQKANNEIKKYFRANPSESRYDLYIQDENIKEYLMVQKLKKSK